MKPGHKKATPPRKAGGNTGSVTQSMFQQGLALHQQGQLEKAKQLYEQVLDRHPRHFDALHLLGVIAAQVKNPALAVELIGEAIKVNPGDAAAYYNRGKALSDLNQHRAALESHDRAIAIKADYAEAHNNRGNALNHLNRHRDAVASYDQAIALKPGYATAWNNRGNALRNLGEQQAALDSYDRAVAARPDHAEAWNNRGVALNELGRPVAALESYDRALAVKAGYAEAFNNRGVVLADLRRPQAALESYDRAIAAAPAYADAYNNRGNTLRDLKQHAAALASYDQAIRLLPHDPAGHWNQGLCHLQMGNFATGWGQYEWRWKRPSGGPVPRHFSQPLWLGAEPLEGKTILLHAEQGLGDTLQFCRYARLVSARGARVVLEVPQALFRLLQGLDGVAELVTKGGVLPAFDFHCPLMSLPLAFQTTIDSIPSPGSYLRASPAEVTEWQARLGPKTRPRVGLVWSGSPTHKNDHNRSASLGDLLRQLPSTLDYVSLQKELRGSDSETLARHPGMLHFGDALEDFGDTAALCQLMDVVISVDTSVAHLAGALGQETWVMLPANPDWRWLLDRTDSPWYASAKLYRQASAGDWGPVLASVGADLMERFAQGAAAG